MKVELREGDTYTIFLRAPLFTHKVLTDYVYMQATTRAKDELEAYQKALVLFPLPKKEQQDV